MDSSLDSHLQMMTTWRVACQWIPFCRSSRTSALKGASVKTLRTRMMKMRRKTKKLKRMTITSTRRPSRNRTRIDSLSSKSAIQNTRSHLKTTLLMLRIRRRRSPL